MTPEQLLAEIVNGLELSADGLRRASRAWAEAARQGMDLSRFRAPVFRLLPLIAAGSLMAETVLAFPTQSVKFRKVSALSPGEQRRIASGEPIAVLIPHGGDYTTRMIPVREMTDNQVKMVFGHGFVRPPDEQQPYFESPPNPTRRARRAPVRVEANSRTVFIGSAKADADEMIEALKKAGLLPL